MTIKNVAKALHGLSVGGFFNGEKFTVTRLENQIRAWMRGTNRIVMQIALPDGWWYFTVTNHNGSYLYNIPETREQEAGVKAILGI